MNDNDNQQQEEGGVKRPFGMDDERLRRLWEIVRDHSLMLGDFTLTSGRKSNYLFQLRPTVMHPEGAAIIGELIVEFMRKNDLWAIGGLEMGAVPIVSAVAVRSHDMGWPVNAFFMRKKAKEHGAKQLFDGWLPPLSEEEPESILIIDDVTTTGGSLLKTALKMREMGYVVDTALSVVDREEGALENLAGHGITLHALLTKSDFAGLLQERNN